VRDVAVALDEHRIEAVYQPIVQLDTRKVIALEALCRLRLPTGELVSASEFKDATTDAKVATALTSRMLERVIDDLAAWRARNVPLPEIVLNVSAADFYAGDLLRKIEVALRGLDFPLSKLTLDVSEDVAASRSDKVVSRQIARLRRHGVRVALDEFGRGQASLTHLIDMSVDEIVIARSFVERLWPADPALVVVQGLIAIARELEIRVVAQGVETEVQASQLWAMGCRYGQGFAFSPALNAETAGEFLHRHGQDIFGSIPVGTPAPTETRRRVRRRVKAA
jgi:EAL domain-containing protein (putative c-di-GMP-specific phosphodiesterase class I)